MSPEKIIQNKITEEINLIPEENRQELYELIRSFRTNLKQKKSDSDRIMEFAGSWLDISDEDFNDFGEEIEQRRQVSASRRFEF
ncbi:conserved hypothetical protein [Hyella patelloides LEGE 07179]|uniref:Uncharacterized protein n=1 Tax=Hyella patelloides LEGE 07179 TaxID=945734 RepID=A0A563W333_9CYAN|nr:hypothetical protein [Hyella patelloides]VEP18060.1 conserved hypothetical protein [Hyella patelloides LEGE 07179]